METRRVLSRNITGEFLKVFLYSKVSWFYKVKKDKVFCNLESPSATVLYTVLYLEKLILCTFLTRYIAWCAWFVLCQCSQNNRGDGDTRAREQKWEAVFLKGKGHSSSCVSQRVMSGLAAALPSTFVQCRWWRWKRQQTAFVLMGYSLAFSTPFMKPVYVALNGHGQQQLCIGLLKYTVVHEIMFFSINCPRREYYR